MQVLPLRDFDLVLRLNLLTRKRLLHGSHSCFPLHFIRKKVYLMFAMGHTRISWFFSVNNSGSLITI